jgi:hypothetical protein
MRHPPRRPTHVHLANGLRISCDKIERFLIATLSACVVFLLCEALKSFKMFRKVPVAADATVSFLMIFFINDYLTFRHRHPDDDSDDDDDDSREQPLS